MTALITMNAMPIEAEWKGPAQCKNCGIGELVLFSSLAKEDFALIHEPIDELMFGNGELLYSAGESADHVFTIREGFVKLTQKASNGDEHIVRLLRRGDVTGLEALVGQAYEHTALVIDAALTCRIPVAVINKLNQQLPHFRQELLSRWQLSVDRANLCLTELRTGRVKARVARLLIQLAEVEPTGVVFIPSREDMGTMLAATTEAVSRVMAEFKRAGLVKKVAVNRFKVDIDGLQPLTN
jgi:CRP/FNR family transcriptional regulator, anaerobic regulatory protein